jgi:hypothetical protein
MSKQRKQHARHEEKSKHFASVKMDARVATSQSPVTHCTEDQVVHWKTGLLSAQGAISNKKVESPSVPLGQ